MGMIDISGLTKSYIIGGKSVLILKGIDLYIEQGEFIAIMGPSGSGKSTLMNMIGILDSFSDGEYLFEGNPVTGFTEDDQAIFRRDKIGFIFQGYNLLPRLSAREQVAIPLGYKGWGQRRKFKRAKEALASLGLEDKIYHTPDMLSGGQQQRVCIARALACDPPLLLADEPTGALDSVTSDELLALFTTLNQQGKTIIMITHDHHVASYASRVVRIKDGLLTTQDA